MKDQLRSIQEFHKAFGIEDGTEPTTIDAVEYMLRYDLMKEENDEYLDACQSGDKVEIADALGDQLVILCGTILKHGMQDIIEDAFKLIHANNMSKLDKNGNPIINGENGVLDVTRPLGKVLKPHGFKPVDLSILIK